MNKVAQGRVTLTPADFVRAATSFVDEHGLDALTMRSLGDRLGVDPTALYRHFPNKDALLAAMLDDLMGKVLAQVPGPEKPPRERLHITMLGARQVFCEHPNLVSALVVSSGQMPNALELIRRGISMLEDLGLHGADLVVGMQMIEGVVTGSSVFDLAGAPHHREIRRLRYRAVENAAYDDVSRDVDSVERVTEHAFGVLLDAVLDACERLATSATTPH
jgi:AcrR family transcriptional regulator